jgi:hypothetical protein
MNPLHQKKLTFALGALIVIIGVLFAITWRQAALWNSDNTGTTPISSVDESIPYAAYHKLVNTADGKIIKNTKCDIVFKLPKNWLVYGTLGESKILSPDDERKNKEWADAPQGQFQDVDGDGPTGPDARSLYISCQDNGLNYLRQFLNSPYYGDFEGADHLADAFATGAFNKEDSNPTLLKTMKIDGRDAYEISDTTRGRDGVLRTKYAIIIEEGNVYEIHLNDIEYDSLPDATKQVIESIAFEN